MNQPFDCDVLIIGAGPAGSTAATLLAERGRKVIVLEKEKFPRYHVGESLMPFCYFTLEPLGLLEEMKKYSFIEKNSVQFVTSDGRKSQPFYFHQHLDGHPAGTTWQVERKEFDHMLMKNAVAKGAEVREETTVKDFLYEGTRVAGVKAKGRDGEDFELRAPLTIDATGRDALYLRKQRTRRRDPELNKIAIWTLYKGAKRDAGLDEGATTIAYLEDRGWFWNIPLKDDIVSSGIVADAAYLYRESRDPAEIFAREIENNAWIKEHLSEGEQFGQYWVTGEYSYRAEHCCGDGLLLVGDAFAFLDPVFSSGVFLAFKTGELAADAAEAALAAGDTSAQAFVDYGESVCEMMEVMRKIVYAFYDPEFSFGRVLKKHERLRPLLTDCLIGDLDGKDFSELMAAIGEFIELPEPLAYGRAPGVGS
jgi:flavin-dependent dehydrogenase